MDYKQKIGNKWPTGEKLTQWLDQHYADWREDQPAMVSEFILVNALGAEDYGKLEPMDTFEAEEWIMETYLGA